MIDSHSGSMCIVKVGVLTPIIAVRLLKSIFAGGLKIKIVSNGINDKRMTRCTISNTRANTAT